MASNLIDPDDMAAHDIDAQVTASGGYAYVSWQAIPRSLRKSFTVHERSGEVTDNHYLDLNPIELVIVCGLLRAAGKDRVADRVERQYR